MYSVNEDEGSVEVCAFRVTGVLQTSVVVTLSTMDMSAQGKQKFNIILLSNIAKAYIMISLHDYDSQNISISVRYHSDAIGYASMI